MSAELHQAGIFNAAVFFIFSLGREHGLGAAAEVDAIAALGIAQAGSAVLVLGAIEHDELAAVENDRWVKRACCFPAVALGRNDGIRRQADPWESFVQYEVEENSNPEASRASRQRDEDRARISAIPRLQKKGAASGSLGKQLRIS